MPRILRIINRFNLGGPTYNAAYLSRFLGEDGLDPSFETKLIGGSPAIGEAHSGFILDNLGVEYTEIPEMSRSINPVNDFKAFLQIRRIIREFRPDIVHTHAAKAGAIGRIAAWMEGVPVIVHTFHGHVFSQYFGSFKSTLARIVERWLAKRSSAIVNISQKLRTEIVETHRICPPEKAFVIPLGFDLRRFSTNMDSKRTAFRLKYKIQNEDLAIGIIGRLAPIKNHRLFLDSIALLRDRGFTFRAFVIGDGDMASELMDYARSIGLDASTSYDSIVVFTSWIKEIDHALAGLDIVALTSLNEGTPVSLIEAQAAGLAIASTNVGGVSDCVLSGESAILTGIDAEAMSDALASLLSSETLRKSFAERGREYVIQHFSYERLVSDTRRLYLQLLAQNKK